jgi:hypothetical protein
VTGSAGGINRHSFTDEPSSQIFGMLEMSEIFGNSHQRILGDLELMRDIAMIDVKAMHKAYSLSPQDSDMELAHIRKCPPRLQGSSPGSNHPTR